MKVLKTKNHLPSLSSSFQIKYRWEARTKQAKFPKIGRCASSTCVHIENLYPGVSDTRILQSHALDIDKLVDLAFGKIFHNQEVCMQLGSQF